VQGAIDDSGGPSTIRVCAGTYTESITIGRALTLIGAGQGDGADDTILHGAGTNVVRVADGTGSVNIKRVRITGGKGANGSGVRHLGTSLTMHDCTVSGNTTDGRQGAGLFNAIGSQLTMIDCTVTDNHVPSGESSQRGGGLVNFGSLTLTRCLITLNTAAISGGGIVNEAGSITIDGGAITKNTAKNTGGGIENSGGTVTLQGGASVTENDPNNCVGTPVPGCSG
jgi:hypothetical protein